MHIEPFPGQGFALENFTYESNSTASAIYQNAKKLQFRGMTVYVLFLHPYQVYGCLVACRLQYMHVNRLSVFTVAMVYMYILSE